MRHGDPPFLLGDLPARRDVHGERRRAGRVRLQLADEPYVQWLASLDKSDGWVPVRYSEEASALASVPLAVASPFEVTDARNVMLETVKRGEDDAFEMDGKRTIILRLFEHYGGHAQATLHM